MRDVRDLFPQMEEVEDPPTKRFRIPAGLGRVFQAPGADELTPARGGRRPAARAPGAQDLATLELKVLSAMRLGPPASRP